MAESSEELGQLQYLYTAYTREYEILNSEISNYLSIASAFERNSESLGKMGQIENANLLVGLEGGTFIEVNTKNIATVITNVGGGYMVEKSVGDSKAFVDKNIAKVQDSLKKLNEQKIKIEKELMDLSFKLNSAQQQ